MGERVDVVVVGAGHAGLSISNELSRSGVEHLVLERARIGESWRGRWDSFCLVTPNWSVQLPEHPYDGDDPDGFMLRDEIVAYLERYAAAVGAPIRDQTEVENLDPATDGGFALRTSGGEIRARSVVIASGAFQRPRRPRGADDLPAEIPQLDVDGYRNPGELPSGGVLIVGSGQTGCQIAEELLGAGREVFLACGRAPWAPRRLGDHDLVWWLAETGFLDQTPEDVAWPAARRAANVIGTGAGGGHDLNLRRLRAAGATLLGHFLGAEGRCARFADDLEESVAWGDDRYRDLMGLFSKLVAERGLPDPGFADPPPFEGSAPTDLDLGRIGSVIFTGGFRPDYRRWVHVPDAFDEAGFPLHVDGASSAVEGLYFVGVHFLRRRKSSLLIGAGEDAAVVGRRIAAVLGASAD
ncbi:MAG TPA: NAD(P)-binding domain-containing protein [Actinomycetota bacterium]